MPTRRNGNFLTWSRSNGIIKGQTLIKGIQVKSILIAMFLSASVLPHTVVAQEPLQLPQVTDRDNEVPYKMVKLSDPELKEIWMDGPDDDSWWRGSDKNKYAKIARFENDLGQTVLVSIWVDREQCANMNCPVRVIVAGERVFNDQVCRFEEDHTLTATRNSAFLCDYVIPLRTSKGEEN